MLPVLFSIGSLSVSSFGFFLSLGFIYGTFLVWRLSRAWDLDEEKILDLTLLTFFGGLIGSRIYFIAEHFEVFGNILKMVLITKYPGFSFWGAFLGGWLMLYFFIKKFKMDFLSVLDIAAVGFFGGLIFGSIGCFLGGCEAGIVSNFLSVNMVGLIGKRFPVQILEALIYAFLLSRIWPRAIRFHAAGRIASLGLIYLGIIKFILEFFRADTQGGHFFALVLIVLGIVVSYRIEKRSFLSDLRALPKHFVLFFVNSEFRRMVIQKASNSWYNLTRGSIRNKKIEWAFRLQKINKVLRRIHVRTHPENIK